MSEDPVGMRRAESGDTAELARLAAAARDDVRRWRGAEALVAARPSADPALWPGTALVGTIGDQIVGYAVVEVRDGRAVLDELYCEPEARGVGVGDALLGGAIDVARAAGATAIDASALPGDRNTKNFFEAHGMVSRLLVVSRSLSPDP
ncbi:MAG TPA: GNAT family N-acetyltransferase [Microthrixaceae bacterium]|nr:GNAT family N-acetyltransferase [Microthrixaceae bacterium]